MELELRYDKDITLGLHLGGHQLFLEGKRTRYFLVDAETRAKHWIATEIEKLIGFKKGIKITVEELATPEPSQKKE